MRRDWLYILAIVWLALLLSVLLAGMLQWKASNQVFAAVWIAGFFFVALNVCYLLVVCLCSVFVKPRLLPETSGSRVVRVAVLYVVKNERGDLASLMARTLAGNEHALTDLWLISNSDDQQMLSHEESLVRALRGQFGRDRVHFYRPERNPLGRKHVAIQRWAADHVEYAYFIVCDADSVLFPDSVSKLIAKAEHTANARFMVFQSHLEITGSQTRFARFLEPGQNIVQKVFCNINFAMFGQSPYYGHGALIRRAPFAQLQVPEAVLSHDLWDTAAVDMAGWGIAFCPDVKTHEMFPPDYIEFRRRSRRWIVGTLEAWPLLFRRGLSLGTRFHIGLAQYIYVVQPVFIIWMLLGLLARSTLAGPLLQTQSVFLGGSSALDFEMGGVSVFTVGLVWTYKLRFTRSLNEALLVLRDVLTGTAVLLNNLFYDSLFIVAAPWTPRSWLPMPKESMHQRTFKECFGLMFPSTCFGAVLTWVGWVVDPRWMLYSSPVLFSFLFGSVMVYWTAKPGRRSESRLLPGPDSSWRERWLTPGTVLDERPQGARD